MAWMMVMLRMKMLISPRELTPRYLEEIIRMQKLITATAPLVTKLWMMFLNIHYRLVHRLPNKVHHLFDIGVEAFCHRAGVSCVLIDFFFFVAKIVLGE